jgi:cyclophilin family peptidyl-prolyl cis-trans isomerase
MSLLAAAAILAFQAGEPVLHPARVILTTNEGEMTVVLFPEVAPRHVAHFLRLVRHGYYDRTQFNALYKNYLLQHPGHDPKKIRSYTPEQRKLEEPLLPVELSALRHERGVLTMMRHEDRLDSAGTSFAILLGPAPNLDGKYTIFGRIEKGLELLDAMGAVEVGADRVPKLTLNLHRAVVEGEMPGEFIDADPPVELVAAGGAMMAAGLAVFLLAGRKLPRSGAPIGLTAVISGFFILFIAATPHILKSETRGRWALVLFISFLALFKLMNRFESPRA